MFARKRLQFLHFFPFDGVVLRRKVQILQIALDTTILLS